MSRVSIHCASLSDANHVIGLPKNMMAYEQRHSAFPM